MKNSKKIDMVIKDLQSIKRTVKVTEGYEQGCKETKQKMIEEFKEVIITLPEYDLKIIRNHEVIRIHTIEKNLIKQRLEELKQVEKGE